MKDQSIRQKMLAELSALIATRVGRDEAGMVDSLAQLFFRSFPVDDLRGLDVADLFGFIYSSFNIMQRWPGGTATVDIGNPDVEQAGWESNHTVVTVIAPDMPFLLDSVRGELNRRNTTIHNLHGQNFSLDRDAGGEIVAIRPRNGQEREVVSLIFFSIDRCTNVGEIEEMKATISEILEEVAYVVSDFPAMRDRLAEVAVAVAAETQIDEETRNEHVAFLQWLDRNNIALLGYEALTIRYSDDRADVVEQEQSRLGMLRLRGSRGKAYLARDLAEVAAAPQTLLQQQLSFSKSRRRSRVHRLAYPDYVEVNEYDPQGRVITHHRFLGLFTAAVYSMSPSQIPIVREKIARVMEASGFNDSNHEGRELSRVLQMFPRDELLQADVEELFRMSTAVNQIQERRQVRLITRLESHDKFCYCMVYMPRDRYSTAVRIAIQQMLGEAMGSHRSEFNTYFSESILVRIYFVFLLDPDDPVELDLDALEAQVVELSQSWEDRLHERLLEQFGEEHGMELVSRYGSSFPAGYREDFDTRIATMDIGRLLQIAGGKQLEMSLYRLVDEPPERLRFRLYHRETSLPLSDVLPILENLGLRVLAENAYPVREKGGALLWIQDFSLSYAFSGGFDLAQVRQDFTDAFGRIWSGEAESDGFNKMLLGSRLDWREISLLRAFAKYLRQILFTFSPEYIAETMAEHVHVAGALVELFLTRFDPDFEGNADWRAERELLLGERIIDALEQVQNLGQDRIIRQYLALIQAIQRTNYFQTDANGLQKSYISFKFRPDLIPGVPAPVPKYEIFVYSPAVEGVHLRGGKVARGGLRWSDRHEDFRTEVLGLVKAQQVKNAVIVPVGAKGGFVCKRHLTDPSREALQKEAVACYQTFIRGLLDLTDNLVEGAVVPPPCVVRKDRDDTYLVVAADKGTATFSDIANAIAREYKFWLDDAFASGGSAGYDHKKMGITARGAWVSVQRHFRELGLDIQSAPFTVVGVGDMAGDVFGNGMLLSEQIQLVAAFNHQHVFVDPNPDPAASFAERQRLFQLPRSSWGDYNADLISAGGGVFSRAAKAITVTPEMQARFDIHEAVMTPAELIHALLKAPCDLLWNGGIGTYVKSSEEQHAEVGDKANDAVRVDGRDLRCRVVGEGGNLGLTQLGRVEYSLAGGRSNTDFIDNAGGVDCSDHEVNIKILLNAVVARGDLTLKHRDKFLHEMTDSVAQLVLRNNYRQVQAISIAESEAVQRSGEYRRVLNRLEELGLIDRELEFLPSDEQLAERRLRNQGLTRPELSVLISYSKGILKEALAVSAITDDSYLAAEVAGGFPEAVLDSYRGELGEHRLHREIVATQIANDLVNRMGVSFIGRLISATGASVPEIAIAYSASREIFRLDEYWEAIEALDFEVDATLQIEMMRELIKLIRNACRWLLRNRRNGLDAGAAVGEFQNGVAEIAAALPGLLCGESARAVQERFQQLQQSGVPQQLAQFVAGADHLYSALGIITAATEHQATNLEVGELFYRLGETLELDWFARLVTGITVENEWQAQARDSYLEDLQWQQRSLAVGALKHVCEQRDTELCLQRWAQQEEVLIERWKTMLGELHAAKTPDFAMFAVANRELLDLAQSSLN